MNDIYFIKKQNLVDKISQIIKNYENLSHVDPENCFSIAWINVNDFSTYSLTLDDFEDDKEFRDEVFESFECVFKK